MTVYNSVAPRRKSSLPWLIGFLFGGFLTVALLATVLWLFTGMGLVGLFKAFTTGGTFFSLSQPSVVRQIQQLKRLETVSYSMDKIIAGEHDSPYLPKFLAGDKLLLVVHGEVIAGVDLAKLQASDIAVHGTTISVKLPQAEILVTRIDNARTRVYSRDTGLFTSPDPNLESEVRQEAERQLVQAAQQDGILKAATENAQNTVAAILKGLGFQTVEFAS